MPGQFSAKAESVTKALIYKYNKTEGPVANVETDEVIDLLRALPEASLTGGQAGLLGLIAEAHPDTVLPPAAHAILASVDDCTKMIFALVDLETDIVHVLRKVIPEVAACLLIAPDLPLSGETSVLTVLDQLVEATIGWSANLGRSGEKLIDRARATATRLRDENPDIPGLAGDMSSFNEREQGRAAKLEERLAASETGLMRSRHARNLAATMINDVMAGKQLTANIAAFLQGPWYDSVQLLLLNQGFDSEQWSRAQKLTETIVWIYQLTGGDQQAAHQDMQRLYRIIEDLPGEIKELLVALEHDILAAEEVLEDIQSDLVVIVSGDKPEFAEFTPIDCEADPAASAKVSRLLLRRVNGLVQGQWFVFDRDDVLTRIKLVLKADDVRQLLFTNRNGVKALQCSFEEFAYYLSSGVVKALNHDAIFSGTFSTYYEGLVEEHTRQLRLIAERRAHFEDELEAREAARQKALDKAAALARANEEAERERRAQAQRQRLEHARAEAEKAENAEAVILITEKVNELAIGAWLRLPAVDGTLETCKLAVRISAADKLIFVSRAGTRTGEYTSEQLVQLLVAGEAEIDDEGVEFEDTLAAVVNRLRQDRNKSYDDLTGA